MKEITKKDRFYIIPGESQRIPSVTEIISGKFGGRDKKINTYALELGNSVHEEIAEYLDKKTVKYFFENCDEDFVHNETSIFLLGVLAKILLDKDFLDRGAVFFAEKSYLFEQSPNKYVGTIDLVLKNKSGDILAIFDFKTGKTKSDTYRLQLAGYAKELQGVPAFLIFEDYYEEVANLDSYKFLFEEKLNNFYEKNMSLGGQKFLENDIGDSIDLGIFTKNLADLEDQIKILEEEYNTIKKALVSVLNKKDYKDNFYSISYKKPYFRESIVPEKIAYLKENHPDWIKKIEVKESYTFVKNKKQGF